MKNSSDNSKNLINIKHILQGIFQPYSICLPIRNNTYLR